MFFKALAAQDDGDLSLMERSCAGAPGAPRTRSVTAFSSLRPAEPVRLEQRER
jgi:hypothetical protein